MTDEEELEDILQQVIDALTKPAKPPTQVFKPAGFDSHGPMGERKEEDQ